MNIYDYLDDFPDTTEEKVIVNQPLIGIRNRKVGMRRMIDDYLVAGGVVHSDAMNFIMRHETGQDTGNLTPTALHVNGISYLTE